MKQFLTVCIFIGALLAGCRQQQRIQAKIFERKELENHRLLIKYQYTVSGRNYTDSATMGNIVISSDTINVIIDPASPNASIPDIK